MRANEFITESIDVYHGTNAEFDTMDVSKTTDGGVHFGSMQQAKMRSAGKNSKIIHASIDISNPTRYKDEGSGWKKKIIAAKRIGYDGIIYLNRYEGLSTERVSQLSDMGQLDRLDSLSDSQFKKLVPEAEDSYIVFYNDQVRVK